MQDCFLNHKQKESRERWGRVAGLAGKGEERGGHFAEPTMANFMQTKTEGTPSPLALSLTPSSLYVLSQSDHGGRRAEFDIWQRGRNSGIGVLLGWKKWRFLDFMSCKR